MALVAPPLSFRSHRHHHHQPPFFTKKSTIKISLLHSFHIPQASLFSTTPKHPKTSLTLSNTSTHQLSLPEQINKLCHSGNLAEALTLLQLEFDHVSSVSRAQKAEAVNILLQACGHQKDIEVGGKLNEIVRASTQFRNDFVINTRIITMYSMCGSPHDARYVFDHLQRKNLYQWNALISGYTRNELWFEAMSVFVELVEKGEYKPDQWRSQESKSEGAEL